MAFHRNALQDLFKNPQPIAAQDLFDLIVGESSLDQSASEIWRVGMIAQIGNEMWSGQFCSKLIAHLLRQLLEEILAKIKTDPDAVDSDQAYHVLNVIHITIERAGFGIWTNENRIYPHNATALTDDLDLLVADVALDVVKLSHVRMRNDKWFARKTDNVLESFWIDVSQIDEDAKPLAFAHDVAAKICQAVARRTAWLENPAAAGRVSARMRQTNRPQAELVKRAQQIQIVA